MASTVLWIERKNGDTSYTRVDYGSGRKETLAGVKRTKSGRTHNGYWQLSETNGITGTEATLKKAMALDKKLGRTIDYVKVKESVGRNGQKVYAWRAAFDSPRDKNNWLRAHKRYDSDAGYGAPCPGDFKKNVPPEFE